MSPRIVAGFLIAPILLPVVTVVVTLQADFSVGQFKAGFALACILAVFTYATALIVGVPVFAWYRRRGWFEPWQFAVGGGLLGLLPMPVIALFGPVPLFLGPVLSVIGLLSALLFWFLAVRGNVRGHGA
jgi:hypothetical protein